jgi:predicted aldo/keto reductase-like oxidoreductase
MPYRPLGRTGEKVSLLGLGGWQLGKMPDEAYSTRHVRTAIDNGVNYVETSWDYLWGLSEHRMGKALMDGYRKKVFLATKIDGRTKPFADWQLEESLRRLRTDHVDLLQFHEVVNMGDPDKIFGPDGAIEAALAAKKAGKIRYIGFTGHFGPAPLLKLVNLGLKNGFVFDTAMVTLNVMDPHYHSNASELLPLLQKHNVGILAFKTLGAGTFMQSGILARLGLTPVDCLRYVMSLPVSVVISGMADTDVLHKNLEIFRSFQPLKEPEVKTLLAKTSHVAKTGEQEYWKGPKGLEWTRDHPEGFS